MKLPKLNTKHVAFDENVGRNGAPIYLSKQDISRNIKDIKIALRINSQLKVLFASFIYTVFVEKDISMLN